MHVRYKSLYISQLSSAKQQGKMAEVQSMYIQIFLKLGLHIAPPYWFIVRQETEHHYAMPSDLKITGFAVQTLSDSLLIYLFPLWRPVSKISRFAAEFSGYVWTKGISGKRKLRIQKYLDTCEFNIGITCLTWASSETNRHTVDVHETLEVRSARDFFFLAVFFFASRRTDYGTTCSLRQITIHIRFIASYMSFSRSL